eukprot:CAMPEP_0201720488 /NCGR_PEP_ID=MMETSP0593-20130828/5414_1 /ASSEMBLY_ACC=CAM_ASM_000672 /TAXON_ID=267983 /ORGANISM="Skeletonema japonicum, Strain CCMP2506" /LENGTH=240 /DNA_ID=CAMNT_0048211127 /DNA_START=17 /DNA_END=739 /DNA_ORIENTATION=-
MVSTTIPSNTLVLLIAICTYLSCEVESFSLHQSSSAATRDVATTIKSQQIRSSSTSLFMSDAALSLTGQEEDDEEEEWVEEEFELLTERDFYNTEWKIGTLMDGTPRSPTSIDTTWVRLMTTEDGTNKAVWGDGSKGKWTIDVPSQFFSISKETFGGWFGKQIWAGTIEDFYYLDGTVRGWSPISPASVDGQWQAIRLGNIDDSDRVSAEERGVAPWFMEEDGEVEGDESEELATVNDEA